MSKVYGIDLGTTYSEIATLNKEGKAECLCFVAEGEDKLASVVYFATNGNVVVGKEAKNMLADEVGKDRVVRNVKRLIGELHQCKNEEGDENVVERIDSWVFDGEHYDPINISSLILKRIKEDMSQQGYLVEDVVITIPAHFQISSQNATRQAGEIAGLNVLNMIPEPTAAAIHYCSREYPANKNIMVFDLGGGTFDIALLDFCVSENDTAIIKIKATKGDKNLGGIDWDTRLRDCLLDKYAETKSITKQEIDNSMRIRIEDQVERLKKTLSQTETTGFSIDKIRLEITRAEFESKTTDLVNRSMNFVDKILEETDNTADSVDLVLLVGGSTKMPMIKNALKEHFPEEKIRFHYPDYAVALGAALYASNQSKQNDEMNVVSSSNGKHIELYDILNNSFGPGVFYKDKFVLHNLVFCGDKNPTEVSHEYFTKYDNQETVSVDIFQNEYKDRSYPYLTPCRDEHGNDQDTVPEYKVKYLSTVSVGLPEKTPKGSPVIVKIVLSARGLDASVTYPLTKETKSIFVDLSGGKTKSEMENEIVRFKLKQTSGYDNTAGYSKTES